MNQYTCDDYRQEMILASLRRQLAQTGLSDAEKQKLREQIQKLETLMGLD
jgi:hypothetical protein